MTEQLPEIVDGLPNVCGSEDRVQAAVKKHAGERIYLEKSGVDFDRIDSACAIALHMHQPLIPAGGDDLHNAEIISNLQHMMAHQDIGDNHNAPVFHWCYKRMGEFIPQLIGEGKQPRAALDYSGTLLYGLCKMGLHDVFDALGPLAADPAHVHAAEWLGTAWGHAVAPSTAVQDFRLHVQAWQHHFAAIFGFDAVARVRGFSPPEMALPNHPDVAYEFVKTLKDCGFQWVLVQEHSVEQPDNGWGPQEKHLPHRLVCRNSHGETAEIIAVIKTQGSDTKLVAQMQPYYEAQGLGRLELAGKKVPPLVTQIADGENGGVMMNEFPPKYMDVVRKCSGSRTPVVNVSEYLEYLFSLGIEEKDLPALQPVHQTRLWEHVQPGDGHEKLEKAIEKLRQQDHEFHMEGGSWTNDISWVKGYDELLQPMDEISALFYEKVIEAGVPTTEDRYRRALYHLMVCETSCFRYWGQGVWVDYGRELCRRAREILEHEF
ncbi:hypothetical protein [Methylohalobius crimeensis]|uniref:hypothetical protein n=1 Tax=Methylohalobius crimeensis TaxID=244365 RepID=UPI0003B6E64C|nr:hypothetical protein [Methylohalobius crimeensis]